MDAPPPFQALLFTAVNCKGLIFEVFISSFAVSLSILQPRPCFQRIERVAIAGIPVLIINKENTSPSRYCYLSFLDLTCKRMTSLY